MPSEIYLFTQFLISTASPLDALTVFLNKLFGSSQTPDGYLMYLLVMCGLFVIGLVLIYNWWEERKFNAQVEKSFSPIKNDALLDQNKKQFLDKFAATTGYLSDAPDAASFGGQKAAEFVDDKSIDDVYSELLDTMSKRSGYKDKPEQHSDGAFNLPNMMIEPKDAPLPEGLMPPTLTGAYAVSENAAQNESPEQHHAIRSIIDQVFRNKAPMEKVAATRVENAASLNSEKLNKTAVKDASALDAYVAIKNSLKLDDAPHLVRLDTAAMPAIEPQKQTQPSPDIPAYDIPVLGDVVNQTAGLSLVGHHDEPPHDAQARATQSAAAEEAQDNQTEESAASPLPAVLNTQVDLIGVLQLSTGVPLDLLVDSFAALHKDFDKPVFVHIQDKHKSWLLVRHENGQNLASQESENQDFATLLDYQQPQKIICSMQLADRSGAASRNVINRFQMAFEAIAANLGGRVQWQNEGDVFSHAMTLDAFCIEVDKTMFFHLMHEATGPFTGIKLKGIAESQKMVLGNDGSFKFFGEADAKYPEFVMFNRDNHPFNPEMLRTSVVKAVTFQLDIPHTLPQAVALDHMVAVAKYMEVGLNAVLVDDNNRPLADMQIERIREQIKSIHAMMQLRGILPGSDIAHRLFS